MVKKERREVEVHFYDICNTGSPRLQECAICGRGLCLETGGKKHFAYDLEVYSYADGNRRHFHFCHDCGLKRRFKQKTALSISEWLHAVMGQKSVK